MKIRIIFYKAKRDGHLLDDAISLYTGIFNWGTGPYSHVEAWWPDLSGDFESVDYGGHFEHLFCGQCFTSTMRGDAKGTVIRPASEVLKNPDRWDYMEIEVDEVEFASAKKTAEAVVKTNKGYDFKAVLGFFLPWRIGDKTKLICSEAVQTFLFWAGIFPWLFTWSPRRLSRKLIERGYVIKPLGEMK